MRATIPIPTGAFWGARSVRHKWLLVLLLWLPLRVWAATDFDALTLREDCNRNEDPLSHGGDWSQPLMSTHASTWEGTGAFCRRDTVGGTASMWWDTTTFGPNVAVSIEAQDAETTTQGYIQVMGRVQQPGAGDAFDGYVCFFELVDEDITIQRVDNAIYTDLQICATLSGVISNGDLLACEIIGNTIKAYIKRGTVWTEECSGTDASNTYPNAGYVAFQVNKNDVTFDSIRFDTLSSAPVGGSDAGIFSVVQ